MLGRYSMLARVHGVARQDMSSYMLLRPESFFTARVRTPIRSHRVVHVRARMSSQMCRPHVRSTASRMFTNKGALTRMGPLMLNEPSLFCVRLATSVYVAYPAPPRGVCLRACTQGWWSMFGHATICSILHDPMFRGGALHVSSVGLHNTFDGADGK